jgi:hypothetical protein
MVMVWLLWRELCSYRAFAFVSLSSSRDWIYVETVLSPHALRKSDNRLIAKSEENWDGAYVMCRPAGLEPSGAAIAGGVPLTLRGSPRIGRQP